MLITRTALLLLLFFATTSCAQQTALYGQTPAGLEVPSVVVLPEALSAIDAGNSRPGVDLRARLAADTARTGAELVGVAIAGGAVGLVAGGYGGARLEQRLSRNCGEMCGLGGALLGGFTGMSVGIPVGAHLANGAAGNLPAGIALTFASGATAAFVAGFLTSRMEAGGVVLVLGVPAVQILTAVSVERSTARRRLSR